MFYGWQIVILSIVATAFGGATIFYGFTAFFDPLIKEFAWSYTAISLAASLRGAEFGLVDVAIGFMADRFSLRKIILYGSIVLGIGWLLLSRVNSLSIFYTSFIIIFIGSGGIGSVVFFILISRWFQKRLGIASGLTLSGYGIGGLAVPGVVYLLDMVGFRSAFLIFGIISIVIGGITAYFVRDWPKDVGASPDGVPTHSENYSEQTKATAAENTSPQNGYTFKEAISKPAFWIITYTSIAIVFSSATVVTHIMPYLENLGYSRHTASIIAMILPATSIVCRVGTGWMSDRIAHRVVLMIALLGQLAAIILFSYSARFFILITSAILLGASLGGMGVVRGVALRNCFGTTRIGSIVGLCTGLSQAGSIAGPLFAGWVFDTTGNYSLVWTITSIILIAGIPLVAIIKQPK